MSKETILNLLNKNLYQVELGPGGRGITELTKEKIEELKEKRAEEKKQEKKDVTVKRTTIQANSKEELLEKISELDWSKITEEKATQGMKFDITI